MNEITEKLEGLTGQNLQDNPDPNIPTFFFVHSPCSFQKCPFRESLQPLP